MDIGVIVRRAIKAASDNTPLILTVIGVTGTITTAVLASQASFKAAEIIRDDILERKEKSRPGERVYVSYTDNARLVWKQYIPAAATAALTVAAIVGANRIGTRRAAALASAYSVSDRLYTEYKAKVVEKFGEKKEKEVTEELARDRANRIPSTEIVMLGTGEGMCYDAYSGRTFQGDMESLRKAVNDTNEQIIHENFASLTDFYHRVGLRRTDASEEVGWTSDKLLEATYDAILTKDGRPCLSISFSVMPIRDYYTQY